MRAFEYTRAASIDEAVALLEDNGQSGVRPLAGGTDLVPLMKADVVGPRQLVDIKHLPELSSGIMETADGVTLGALTRLSSIETNELVLERYTALGQAAALAATPQLRNMATLGGNLLQRPRCWYYRSSLFHCWLKGGQDCPAREGENQLHAIFDASPCVAVHPSDLATALVALDARVRLNSRTLSIDDFFELPGESHRIENQMRPDELVLGIELPRRRRGARSTYVKAMNRKVWAFALVGVAVSLRLEEGHIADARLVLGGVAPTPWRATAAEQLLNDAQPSASLFEQVANAALADARPLTHNGYKVVLAKSLIRQALESSLQ